MKVQARISQLAAEFTTAVLATLRGGSLADLGDVLAKAPASRSVAKLGPAPRRQSRRLPRRSSDDLKQALSKVVGALQKGPLGANAILRAVGMDRREWPKVVELGLKTKALTKKGQKRSTIYSAK